MSDDAVVYVYENVGVGAGSDDGTEYVYQNVGIFGVDSVIGRVKGFAGPPVSAYGYTYENIGPSSDDASDDGTDYVYQNVVDPP